MNPIKTYKTTEYVFYQCDGNNHYCTGRDNGMSLMISLCDKSCSKDRTIADDILDLTK